MFFNQIDEIFLQGLWVIFVDRRPFWVCITNPQKNPNLKNVINWVWCWGLWKKVPNKPKCMIYIHNLFIFVEFKKREVSKESEEPEEAIGLSNIRFWSLNLTEALFTKQNMTLLIGFKKQHFNRTKGFIYYSWTYKKKQKTKSFKHNLTRIVGRRWATLCPALPLSVPASFVKAASFKMWLGLLRL